MSRTAIATELSDEIKEWLRTKTKATAGAYGRRLRKFMRWYKSKYGDVDIGHFLDRLDENLKLPRRERKHLAELEFSEYLDHLIEVEKLAAHTIRNNFVALQNFLDYKGYSISMKWIGNMPKARGKDGNSKHRWTPEQIREFVDRAPTYRDKAIILTMFQSGLAVNELCKLNYGHIEHDLTEGILPIMINMVRDKNDKEFRTFIGADAVKYLRLYLETRSDLSSGSPLFTVERSRGSENNRMTKAAIQMRFREIADGLSYIDLNGEMNPARPHSMRSAFRSRLTGKLEEDLIEFFLGHTVSETKIAYINLPDDELRELYAGFEHELSIETTSKDLLAEREGRLVEISEETQRKFADMERTISTLGTLLNKQIEANRQFTLTVENLADQVEEQQFYIDLLKDDSFQFTEEQLRWLRAKKRK